MLNRSEAVPDYHVLEAQGHCDDSAGYVHAGIAAKHHKYLDFHSKRNDVASFHHRDCYHAGAVTARNRNFAASLLKRMMDCPSSRGAEARGASMAEVAAFYISLHLLLPP